jgi:hypothetical protein
VRGEDRDGAGERARRERALTAGDVHVHGRHRRGWLGGATLSPLPSVALSVPRQIPPTPPPSGGDGGERRKGSQGFLVSDI